MYHTSLHVTTRASALNVCIDPVPTTVTMSHMLYIM